MSGDTVTFSSDGPQTVGTTQAAGNGVYQATVTASTKTGTFHIKAADGSVNPTVQGSAPLTQTAGPSATVAVTLQPSTVGI